MDYFGVEIAGTGSYVPARVLTNHELEKMVDTTDQWIVERTGIRERRIAAADEPTSALAYHAATQALTHAGVPAEELDLIIVATLSPDTPFPNTGCHLQKRLNAPNAACFSLEAACSGFIFALKVGADMVRCGGFKKVLVVAAEKLSMFVDWTDRGTCVLFGDGAGAVVLRRVPREGDSLLATRLGSDGNYADLLNVPAGGSLMPITHERIDQRLNFLKMSGREVFKLAVNAMVDASEGVLAHAEVRIDQVRWLVPHQANMRIISGVGKRLGIPNERVYVNLDKYGNTSAASIPIALDEIVRAGKVQRGDYILMTAFGGGLTWGSALCRW
ncbi:MAG: 3-oxoacyl-ACP synthase [Lentisphaerae bacterium RIFOXYB12_FULL_65_16]|nr:MAG: 3-oxoacyl-ACP synthase [Lentisphaerae bacterium RIFOXYA12_64_32]OGV85397.1 MAG: 3-oxoacyl-ACP synthase [Lentisphaerae bacterium RIFOXYB12_FULL_65_16]